MEIITFFRDLSLLIGIWVAIYGIDSWRREHKGKREIELAEDVLALFYEARDAIRYMRHIFSPAGECVDIEKSPVETDSQWQARKNASIVFKRYEDRKEVFNRLYAMRYRFMAQIGTIETQPFDDLHKIVNEIFVAARMLSQLWPRDHFRTEEQYEAHQKQVKQFEAVFWQGLAEEDPIEPRINKTVAEIEGTCREIITGAGTLHALLNRSIWKRSYDHPISQKLKAQHHTAQDAKKLAPVSFPFDTNQKEVGMKELRFIVEIEGFDRVLYKETAQWDKCTFSMNDTRTAYVEIWEDDIDTPEKLQTAAIQIKEKLRRLVLSIEWAYGRELKIKTIDVHAPSFIDDKNLLDISESLELGDQINLQVEPRNVPMVMPEVPIEAERWIGIWVEAIKLGDYVEEQLRRQYLIIEELWSEFQSSFDAPARADIKRVKLIRDFVSHASCNNADIIGLVEPDLPSAVVIVDGAKTVAFQRTVEHKNYISRFEVVSRELARSLVDIKMRQFGNVCGV
jgi:hypothetical protein